MKPFRRSKTNKKIAGVCGGLSNLVGIDAGYIRLAFVLLAVLPPVPFFGAVLLYGALAYFIDKEDDVIDV